MSDKVKSCQHDFNIVIYSSSLNAQKVYNVTMLVVVTIRTTVVTIIIASVNVDSKVPAKILNSIATNQYNTEVSPRFSASFNYV